MRKILAVAPRARSYLIGCTRLGVGNALLRQVARRRLDPPASPPLFLEYEKVLKRPEHRLAHGLPLEAIDEFLAELAAVIEPAEVHFSW